VSTRAFGRAMADQFSTVGGITDMDAALADALRDLVDDAVDVAHGDRRAAPDAASYEHATAFIHLAEARVVSGHRPAAGGAPRRAVAVPRGRRAGLGARRARGGMTVPNDDPPAPRGGAGPGLFDPLALRGLALRNRVAVSPMCQYSSADGFATDWHLVHLGARAVGGAGLVLLEATAVTPEGRISPWDLGLWDDAHVPMLARVAAFVRAQGAAVGCSWGTPGARRARGAPGRGAAPCPPRRAGGSRWGPAPNRSGRASWRPAR
jgi:hypothetical protein